MTDLADIRIITLIESDVQKVCDLVSVMFDVHQADSVNKSKKLGEEKVGYRSVHFVCDVGKEREKLPEFSGYKGLCFEIQIRTALEHAWAEIEHDRGYKLGGRLPSHLNRRFKLLSGLLESADLEFNRLTVEIEEYAKQLNNNLKKDKLDYELTDIGLMTFLENKYGSYKKIKNKLFINQMVGELSRFGINDLKQLDELINKISSKYTNLNEPPSLGYLRTIMMLDDLEKYFECNFKNRVTAWHAIRPDTLDLLLQKYDQSMIDKILSEYKINKLPII